MYFVYILYSDKDHRLYIGFTTDLPNRIQQHKSGQVFSTKHRLPVRLVFYESYIEKKDAKKRELFLKGGKGHAELKKQLKETYKRIGYRFNS